MLLKRATLLLLFLVSRIIFLHATEEPYVNSLKGAQVAAGNSFTVTDEKIRSASTINWQYLRSVDNIISFEIDFLSTPYFYNAPFSCNLNITIDAYQKDDTTQLLAGWPRTIDLSVKYTNLPGAPYKGIAYYKFIDAHKYKVTINSITSTELGTNLPAIFIVKGATIVSDRKYNLQLLPGAQSQYEQVGNDVIISFNPADFPGAEMYDIEYTFIDEHSLWAERLRTAFNTGGDIYQVPADTLKKWFRNNASRVTLSGYSYKLNLAYDTGFILFRVRGVQQSPPPDEIRVATAWNYTAVVPANPTQKTAVFHINGHEPDLNWQYSIKFAEEGRRKEVLSYFDGSLRNRQIVTINNSDNRSVVQESIYDDIGRPVVRVLPSPADDSTVHYFRSFNRNKFGNAFSFADIVYANCGATVDSMSSSSGAAQYYSKNNPFTSFIHRNYIPDAEGFPFAVTEYTPDNTGRVKRQSESGKNFQLNSGHERTYFYGKPTQTELDRLFGNEAGNASHYLKNMVVDPNGQISVSYLDADNRTIAAALAGKTPPTVDGLPSNNSSANITVSNDLILPQQFVRNAGNYSLSTTTTFLAAVTGDYNFSYNVDPLRYEVIHGQAGQFTICNTCYYDLEILVKDECGLVLHRDTLAAGFVFDTACNPSPAPLTGDFLVSISRIGEYFVTYNLLISKDALDFYDSTHLVKNTNIKKLNYFLRNELRQSDFTGCYSNCETCEEELGQKEDFNDFIRRLFARDSIAFEAVDSIWANNLYDSLYANCQFLKSQPGCAVSPCDDRLELLKADVTPAGQYALIDTTFQHFVNIDGLDDTTVVYSFHDDGTNVLFGYTGIYFTDEFGKLDSVVNANNELVPIKELNQDEFVKNWKDIWADSLVTRHKEYCYYLWCLANPGSYAFDDKIRDFDDADSAIALGYFNREDYDALLDYDPFFTGGLGSSLKQRMSDSLRLFSRTLMRFSVPDKNILEFIDITIYCKDQQDPFNNCMGPDSACRSSYQEWLLYRNLYLNLKQKFYEEARRNSTDPILANCVNCFIGDDVLGQGGVKCTPEPYNDFTIVDYPHYACTTGECEFWPPVQIVHNGGGVPKKMYLYVELFKTLGGTVVVPLLFDAGQDMALLQKAGTGDTQNPFQIDSARIVASACNLYTPFTDSSTCSYSCPSGIYDPYDREDISYYVQYGTPNVPPSGVPQGYAGCQFYNIFDVPTGASSNCRFFNVWVCVYDSSQTPGGGGPSSCGSFYSGTWPSNSGFHIYPDEILNLATVGAGALITVDCDAVEIPNRFTIYDASGSFVASTGWIGNANYPGPWGSSLNQPSHQFMTFTKGASATYKLRVETVTSTTTSDAWFASLTCGASPNGGPPCSPACGPPGEVTIAQKTTTSLLVSWTASVSSTLQYDWKISAASNPTVVLQSGNVATTSVNITGLSPQVLYRVEVRSNCGSSSSYWVAIECATKPLPATITMSCSDHSCTQQGSVSLIFSFNQPTAQQMELYFGEIQQYSGSGQKVAVGYDLFALPPGVTPNNYYSTVGPNVPFRVVIPAGVTSYTASNPIYQVGYNPPPVGNTPWICHNCLFPMRDMYLKINSPSAYYYDFTLTNGGITFHNLSPTDSALATCTQITTGPPADCQAQTYPSACADNPLAAVYKNKIRRYPDYVNTDQLISEVLSGNPVSQIEQNEQAILAECRSACEAQADSWIAALSKCNADQAQLDQLRWEMIDICQQSCSSQSIFGASSVAGGPSTYQSFEEAIIGILGPGAINDTCTAELLANPYPHDKQPAIDNRLIYETNYGVCNRIAQFKNEWTTSGFSGSFHAYLQIVLRADYQLDSLDLDNLLLSCTDCNGIIKEPVSLPIAFEPNARPCLDRATALSLKAAFDAKYNITSSNRQFATLLANYFNHALGFSLPFSDYQDYLDSINANSSFTAKLCNLPVNVEVSGGGNDDNSCVVDLFNTALENAYIVYNAYIDSVRRDFRNGYMTKCMNVDASLTMTAKLYEYHYTLYYYDQSGNLVKTIPPEGVRLLDQPQIDSVQLFRKLNTDGCYKYSNYFRFNPSAASAGSVFVEKNFRQASYSENNPYTFEMWVKPTSLADQGLFSHAFHITNDDIFYAGASLSLVNQKLNFYLYGMYGGSPDPDAPEIKAQTGDLAGKLVLNEWNHIAVTVQGAGYNSVRIFLNGQIPPLQYLKDTLREAVISENTVGYSIGQGYTWNEAQPGWEPVLVPSSNTGIKQFRLYNRVLSADELRQNAFSNCLLPSSPVGLQAWLPFTDISSITDLADPQTYAGINDDVILGADIYPIYPPHTLPSTYEHNSLNEIVKQTSPDAGEMRYWFDRLGNLAVSQSAEQRVSTNSGPDNRYTYIRYDNIGRKVEFGEKINAADVTNINTKDIYQLENWMNDPGTSNEEVTRIIYDNPVNPGLQSISNSRKRVVASVYLTHDTDSEGDSTLYCYDILGNVSTLVQHVKALVEADAVNGRKSIEYEYDLVSGNVNKVIYQRGKGDQFFYKYSYDSENKVTSVSTSRDNLVWLQDVTYQYYLHGPLARSELGHYKVQGVDLAYTLQGWIKGVNGNRIVLHSDSDMGKDGETGTANAMVSRDVMAYSLGYFDGDYKQIGGSAAPAFALAYQPPSSFPNTETGNDLFNGNISNIALTLNKLEGGAVKGYSYRYDQLNRLKQMRMHNIASGSSWNNTSIVTTYRESVAYDANGNILQYLRNGANGSAGPLEMDSLNYNYNRDESGNLVNNRLRQVRDEVGATNYATDIDNQANEDNYTFDNDGNLIADEAENIGDITWSAYGRIRSVDKTVGTDMVYGYDAAGYRTYKQSTNGDTINRTFYVRDAKGNVLAIYSRKDNETIKWEEQQLYGNSRIGAWQWDTIVPPSPPVVQADGNPIFDSLVIGRRIYELVNQLGSVLTTISDKKIGHVEEEPVGECTPATCTVDWYEAEVVTQSDYYPFGMLMPGRDFKIANGYRYGYNGKEQDNEVKGEGNQVDYGMRIYDPRLGRFLSVDPMASGFAWWTPYQYAGNSPVTYIDIDGAELSKKLEKIGIDLSPAVAGFIDGFYDNFGFLSALEFAGNMIFDQEYRDNFINAVVMAASDPIAFAEMMAEDYIEKAKNIAAWNEQGKYDAGYIVGELVGGVLSGGAVTKLIKYANKFSHWKLVKEAKRINALIQKYGLKKIAGNPCGCLTEETQVLTEKGLRPIAELKNGDLVWSYSDSTRTYELKPIYGHYNLVSDTLYTLTTKFDRIKVTRDHPFLTQRGWLESWQLLPTDSLFNKSGVYIAILSISKKIDPQRVYNFEVKDFHTYIISNGNVVVHNSIGPVCDILNKVRTAKGEMFGFYRIIGKKDKDGKIHYYVGKGPESRAADSKVIRKGNEYEWFEAPDERTAFIYEYKLMEDMKKKFPNDKSLNVRDSPGFKYYEALGKAEKKAIDDAFIEAMKKTGKKG
jgi:RHS repeat-associated protein